MTTLPLAELVEDFSIYPRHAVDDANVASLVNALKTGTVMPPIACDKISKRITDGWHRGRAYRRVLGPEAVVPVELIDYGSEAEMLLDAIRRNAAHGRKLDAIDQVRAIRLCQQRHIELTAVAAVLCLPVEKAQKLSIRLAVAPKAGPGTIPGTVSVALKRPLTHMVGQTFTAEQMEAHDRAPGVSYLMIANQLADALVVGFINREDERLRAALSDLYQALGKFLKQTAA